MNTAVRDDGTFTARQLTLLEAVFAGKSNKEIAKVVGSSPLTVKNHLPRIYRKLDARNRAEAVYNALARGILKLPSWAPHTPLPPIPPVTDWQTVGNVRASPSGCYVEVAGKQVTLRRKNLRMLMVLISHPRMCHSRQAIMNYACGMERVIAERVIDNGISELRRSLSEAGADQVISTMREHGYALMPKNPA